MTKKSLVWCCGTLLLGGITLFSCQQKGIKKVQTNSQPPIEQPIKKGFQRTNSNSNLLLTLMQKSPNKLFDRFLKQANSYEIQIIYTQINRDKDSIPSFIQHNFRVNNNEYFNPASLVKLPIILLAIEKMNQLAQKEPINLNSKMIFKGTSNCAPHIDFDKISNTHPTLSNYIKEMILVSDDNAYNRAYDFLGQAYIHEQLTKIGYDSIRIVHRFAPCNEQQNRETPAIQFLNQHKLLYTQEAQTNPLKIKPVGAVLKGKSHWAEGQLIQKPKEYTYLNRMSLQEINDLLLFTIFPQLAPPNRFFKLTKQDYVLIQKYLCMYPQESEFNFFKTNKTTYPKRIKKYLFYGQSDQIPEVAGLKIYNMVGQSHGTLSDVAYFKNQQTGIEFILSAVINTCVEGVIAPTHYRYQQDGFPFLAQLGQLIYAYERQQKEDLGR